MYAEIKETKQRKNKITDEQSECRLISIGYNGFVRIFQTGEIGHGLKTVNRTVL